MQYNRQKAVQYALHWWNARNPRFYNFENLGGDCTNFVSQCLNFAGIQMDFAPNGWFYNNLNSRAPAWTGVNEFYTYGINNSKNVGVKFKECPIEETEIGDLVQLVTKNRQVFHHTAIITEKLGNTFSNIFITCHTNNAKNKPLSAYNIKNYRFLKVLN